MISQVQLLSKIISDNNYSIITTNDLTKAYFFNYEAEFLFIKNHYDRYGKAPDKLSFLQNFPEFDFVEVNEPYTYLLEQVYKDYNESTMAAHLNKIKPLLESGDEVGARKLVLEMIPNLHTGVVMTCTDLMEDTSRYEHFLEKMTDQSKYYISTGFPELDRLIGGIDRQNENCVISARPGRGKTQVLIKIATAAALQGLTVGIFEGEMSTDKIGYRIDTCLGHIRNSSINRGDPSAKREYDAYLNELRYRCNNKQIGHIKVLTQNDVPGGAVTVNTLRTFIENEKLDILFVDQYSLLDDEEKRHVAEFEKVGNIARDMKKLQVEKQIPVIAVSQMNRTKNDDKSQDTTQIALSDKIPQYATVLICLEQEGNEGNAEFPVTVTLNIVKSRDGGDNRKLSYNVNFNTGNWEYVPDTDDGVTSEADLKAMHDEYESEEIY